LRRSVGLSHSVHLLLILSSHQLPLPDPVGTFGVRTIATYYNVKYNVIKINHHRIQQYAKVNQNSAKMGRTTRAFVSSEVGNTVLKEGSSSLKREFGQLEAHPMKERQQIWGTTKDHHQAHTTDYVPTNASRDRHEKTAVNPFPITVVVQDCRLSIFWITLIECRVMAIIQSRPTAAGHDRVMSGPLWPDLNHNSKRATLYGSSVPYTRQSTNQEDSLAISGLTTNGEIYTDKTYFIPLGGERSL